MGSAGDSAQGSSTPAASVTALMWRSRVSRSNGPASAAGAERWRVTDAVMVRVEKSTRARHSKREVVGWSLSA